MISRATQILDRLDGKSGVIGMTLSDEAIPKSGNTKPSVKGVLGYANTR